MPDAEDARGAALQREKDAVVAEASAERASQVSVQRGDVAGAGPGEVENALEDAHRRWLVQPPNIGPGFIEPLNSVWRHHLAFSDEAG